MEATIWIIVLLFDAGLAFIPATMAKKKGRSFGGYWCLSFFLSFLVAIIVVACVSDLTQQAPRTQPVSPDPGFYPPSSYPQANQAYNAPMPGPQPGVVYCSKCGAQMSSSDSFCFRCGAKVAVQ